MQAKGGWCLTLSVHHTGGEILCTDGNAGAQQRRPALLMPYVLRALLSRILGVLRLFTCGAMPFGYCALGLTRVKAPSARIAHPVKEQLPCQNVGPARESS